MVIRPHLRKAFRGGTPILSIEGISLELGATQTWEDKVSLEGISLELGATQTWEDKVSLEGISLELGVTGPNLNSDLVSYWSMLGSASATDLDVLSAHDLTQSGGVGSTAGKVGNCRTFDGSNDYLTTASTTELQLGDKDRTFAFWAYLTNKTNTQTLIAKHDGTGAAGSEFRAYYDQAADRFAFDAYNGSTTYTATANNFGSPSTATWYFIVCKHDTTANEISISVNDGTANSTTLTGGANSTAIAFTVGGDSIGAVLLTGRIDELAIYSKILKATETLQLYNAGSGRAFTALGGI